MQRRKNRCNAKLTQKFASKKKHPNDTSGDSHFTLCNRPRSTRFVLPTHPPIPPRSSTSPRHRPCPDSLRANRSQSHVSSSSECCFAACWFAAGLCRPGTPAPSATARTAPAQPATAAAAGDLKVESRLGERRQYVLSWCFMCLVLA